VTVNCYMSDRAAGRLAPPKVCRPLVSADASCACGLLWSKAQECSAIRQRVQSCMFHSASVQLVDVLQLQCQCGQVLQYDGLEDAVLNLRHVYTRGAEGVRSVAHHLTRVAAWQYTAYACRPVTFSFAAETVLHIMQAQLLYLPHWSDVDCCLERPASYILYAPRHRHLLNADISQQAWQVCMKDNAGVSKLDSMPSAWRITSACCRFGAAWLDYISSQNIDFRDSLSCACEGKQRIPTRIGADGIMLGCQAQKVNHECSTFHQIGLVLHYQPDHVVLATAVLSADTMGCGKRCRADH